MAPEQTNNTLNTPGFKTMDNSCFPLFRAVYRTAVAFAASMGVIESTRPGNHG